MVVWLKSSCWRWHRLMGFMIDWVEYLTQDRQWIHVVFWMINLCNLGRRALPYRGWSCLVFYHHWWISLPGICTGIEIGLGFGICLGNGNGIGFALSFALTYPLAYGLSFELALALASLDVHCKYFHCQKYRFYLHPIFPCTFTILLTVRKYWQ